MAKAKDTYTVTLKQTHLDWGKYRNNDNRSLIGGEAYIPIPAKYAKEFNLQNENGSKVKGINLFNCTSSDGKLNCVLKAQGCSKKNDIYAKQFSADGNLKILGKWFEEMDAKVGDQVQVTWITETDIEITLIKH